MNAPDDLSSRPSIGQCATLACLWEVIAPKPGNVHRGADFEDLSFGDFAVSAVAIAPAMQAAAEGLAVGRAILQAVRDTRTMVATNSNLGIVLLLAPLAAVPRSESLSAGVPRVLDRLTPQDTQDVYEAIRLAAPGGLGKADNDDVFGPAPESLVEAMRQAADRDLVARQYATGFADVLQVVAPLLRDARRHSATVSESIVRTHVQLMGRWPDTLIARKCGLAVAREAQARAAAVLAAGEPGDEEYLRALADLDFWLRSDGHRRNPGATADLIAAGLFALLRDEGI